MALVVSVPRKIGFNVDYRYIDDVFFINNPNVKSYQVQTYSCEHEIKKKLAATSLLICIYRVDRGEGCV